MLQIFLHRKGYLPTLTTIILFLPLCVIIPFETKWTPTPGASSCSPMFRPFFIILVTIVQTGAESEWIESRHDPWSSSHLLYPGTCPKFERHGIEMNPPVNYTTFLANYTTFLNYPLFSSVLHTNQGHLIQQAQIPSTFPLNNYTYLPREYLLSVRVFLIQICRKQVKNM